MQFISLRGATKDAKIRLLRELGYDSDGKYVLKEGQPVVDKYVDEKVTLDNMLVLPGSAVVITDNPLSIAAYFEEYGDWD